MFLNSSMSCQLWITNGANIQHFYRVICINCFKTSKYYVILQTSIWIHSIFNVMKRKKRCWGDLVALSLREMAA